MRKQIIKISFDDSRTKYEKENIILIDKKISNLVNPGDLIEISDSSLVLKVIAIEKNKRHPSYKYNKLLNLLEEKIHSKFDPKTSCNRKLSADITKKNFINFSKNEGTLNLKKYLNGLNIEKETNTKLFNSYVANEEIKKNETDYLKSEIKEVNDNKLILHKSYPYIGVNNKKQTEKEEECINEIFENLNNQNYQRREDDKQEYKIIYEEEQSEAFKLKDELLDINIKFESNETENESDNIQDNLGIIKEDSQEFELEDVLNHFNLNDDEEFFLEGKYFDNIYQDRLKTKQEKMDLIYKNIIKRQKSNNSNNNQEQMIPSIKSSEDIDRSNRLRHSKFYS